MEFAMAAPARNFGMLTSTIHLHTETLKHLFWMHKTHLSYAFLIVLWCCSPMWAMASSFLCFLDHTQRRTTVGRTPTDGWSAHRRDLFTWQRTTLRTDKHPCIRRDSNTVSAGKRLQTHAIDRGATAIGKQPITISIFGIL